MLLYTDGLIERPGQSIDEGFERLREVASLGAADPGVLAGHVLREMLGDAVRPDDVALLAVHLVRFPGAGHPPAGPRDDLASLREELRVWLGRQDVPIAHVEEIILACSEATANAMEHAYGAREGPCASVPRVTAARSWSGSATLATGGRRENERGRGLGVIDAMMDNVEILKRPEGTEVRMVRRLSSSA